MCALCLLLFVGLVGCLFACFFYLFLVFLFYCFVFHPKTTAPRLWLCCCLPFVLRHHLSRHIAPVLDPALAISVAKGEDAGGNAGELRCCSSEKTFPPAVLAGTLFLCLCHSP